MLEICLALVVALNPQVGRSDNAGAPDDMAALRRIHAALRKPTTVDIEGLKPTFRTSTEAKQIHTGRPDYTGGPRVPGGLYDFELRQLLGNPWAGVPLVKIDVLPFMSKAVDAIEGGYKAHLARAAREEVRSELANFCEANGCVADLEATPK